MSLVPRGAGECATYIVLLSVPQLLLICIFHLDISVNAAILLIICALPKIIIRLCGSLRVEFTVQ